jgi:hypothetical protein
MARPRKVKAWEEGGMGGRVEEGWEKMGGAREVISPRRLCCIFSTMSAYDSPGRVRRKESFVRAASVVRSWPKTTPALPIQSLAVRFLLSYIKGVDGNVSEQ